MKILFAIAEAYPFVKVGGLADVGGALPKMLVRLGHDVRMILPGYSGLGGGRKVATPEVPMGSDSEHIEIRHHGVHQGVEVFTADSENYFGEDMIYGGYEHDDVVPFVLFSKAIVEFADFVSGQGWRPDVIHCNDWHTGLVPPYTRRGPHRIALENTGIVFTVHNLAYQGRLSSETRALTNLADQPGEVAEDSMLARGIASADVVNTVSWSYLEEILMPERGVGLDGLLRSRRGDLYGVLNGVDYEEFNPRTDPRIAAEYDHASFVAGRRKNKAVLQRRSGLTVSPDTPLLGMVARLVEQKGLDVLCEALDRIDALGAQVVVMGRGEKLYQLALVGATHTMENVAYHPTNEEALARQVYAGSDLFLAPSSFEPCGLGPLIALRYGSVPLVRHTGGLRDTIRDYREDPRNALGFTYVRKGHEHLVRTVEAALWVYGRKEEWRALQRRAMAADFSWEESARCYGDLYLRSIFKRRALAGGEVSRNEGARVRRPAKGRRAVPLALVHHANQYLISDGYDNREGISELVEGYAAVLRLHEKYGVPANLHLSGTLIETAAWHHPWFLELVSGLRTRGFLELVGGTYSENIMTLFDRSFNRRQLDEQLRLYESHLKCPSSEVKTFWVPERVWDTRKLSPLITDAGLANGGYRSVLLDDRLLYPTNGSYPGSPRELFDSVKAQGATFDRGANLDDTCRPYRISGADGLVVTPISSDLRYWVPPQFPGHWRRLEGTVSRLSRNGADDVLLVYADDLEKTAGVGPWEQVNLDRYEDFLRWVSSREDVIPVLLSEVLEQEAQEERELEAGAYRELSRDWEAGEDYRAWSEDAGWARYKAYLDAARRDVEAAEKEGADARLVELAWKQLMASAYETAWHEPAGDGPVVAPWAQATASHARSCRVMTGAARWFVRKTADRRPSVEVSDVDRDGEEEIILSGERLYAVLSPVRGGRLTHLFTLAPHGGALVVGNHADDWNWQEELNRYMDQPPNHPGALADSGFEHDHYEVSALGATAGYACVRLTNVEKSSELFGASKSLLLVPESPALVVRYEMPYGLGGFSTETCLSPDYLRLLRWGRRDLSLCGGENWRGCRNGDVAVWVGMDPGEGTVWTKLEAEEAGHGINVRAEARSRTFHLLLGCGPIDEVGCRRLIERGRTFFHRRARRSSRIRSLEALR